MKQLNGHIIQFGGVTGPNESEAQAAILCAPVEATVSYCTGTSLGPAAIMQASSAMELYDELLKEQVMERGILTRGVVTAKGSVEQAVDQIKRTVARELAAGRLPVVLGGEHTVSLGALQAMVDQYGSGFTVCVLDAHLDLRDSYQGHKITHATVMRRVMELGLRVKHLGTRSLCAKEARFLEEQNIEPMWARRVYQDPNWLEDYLSDIEGPVYLSLDVDGLDPAVMPATGTPEPGGLNWEQVSDWLLALSRKHRILGLDLVELSPLAGQAAWDFTAARLLYRAIGLALRSRE